MWRRAAILYCVSLGFWLIISLGFSRGSMDRLLKGKGNYCGRTWVLLEVCGGEPWCIGDNFNTTRFPVERNREGRILGSMRRFS